MDIYYINGEFVDEEKAALSVKDIAILRGYGVFEFMITYNKKPYCLEDHVARLEHSAREIGLKLNHTAEQICKIVFETVKKNSHHEESNVRIVYSGGVSSDGITPEGNGVLIVMVTPKNKMPESWYINGAAVVLIDIDRFMPTAKSTNYLTAVYAQQQAKKNDAIEAVYVDKESRVLEGTTSNFFGVKQGSIVTPPDGILQGITRKTIINLVKKDYALEQRHITTDELKEFDEVFITASNKEVVPIVRIDNMTVGSGDIGPVTQDIMKRFKKFTSEYGLT